MMFVIYVAFIASVMATPKCPSETIGATTQAITNAAASASQPSIELERAEKIRAVSDVDISQAVELQGKPAFLIMTAAAPGPCPGCNALHKLIEQGKMRFPSSVYRATLFDDKFKA